jgi:hypothetical protein
VRVGMKVRVRQGALVYGKSYQFHSSVYRQVYDLLELRGDRGVIFYRGVCTGAVNVNDFKINITDAIICCDGYMSFTWRQKHAFDRVASARSQKTSART